MKRLAKKEFWLATTLGIVSGFSFPVQAQPPGLPAAGASTPTMTAPAAPPLPMMQSPVDVFRKLLALSPADRKLALTNRPTELQKRILAKLREYESLKPEDRELRLRATELQWYLQPLMSVPRANRAARLAVIPPDVRKVVEERLRRWDTLLPGLQQELLNNEAAARYFSQSEAQRTNTLSKIPPERRARFEAEIERWRGLSEEQRQRKLASFNGFFELTPTEKSRALNKLSDVERRQMEKTLQAYQKLSPIQRAQCIRSFEKFASMSLPERQSFLKNAEHWTLMSPAERNSWRKLVNVAPILPPPPTLPPAATPRARTTAAVSLATN